ncbi:hypothetical protein JKF63_03567 [Porcisia hertigi]|uniref:Uncharacterized protein n=1 Tax=Porcisia hertigi TaxID=2761500 RepID=A0A836HWJ3_9TRYP|nr:hypothetical protein JKF63_03567 [Porcisia hertigi]
MGTAYLFDARRLAWAHTRGGPVASAEGIRQLSVLFVQSELSSDLSDEVTDATAVPTAGPSSSADTAPIPVSSVAVPEGNDVVDVDALDSAGTDGAEDARSFAIAPTRSQRVGRLALRDAVVLSYRSASDDHVMHSRTVDTPSADDAALPPADELLSVATEDSRVFLRRSGLATAQRSAGVPPLHMWRGCNRNDTEKGLQEEMRSSAGNPNRSGTFFEWGDCASSSRNESAARPSSRIPITVSSARWRQEASVLLEHARGTLHRVRPRCDAFRARMSISSPSGPRASPPRSACGHCQADYVALSTSTVSLVQSREYGADLVAIHHTVFACGIRANATCMDDWGPHSTVVGFSDGTLRVVDWRMPATGSSQDTSDGAAPSGDFEKHVALCTHVPQPSWLRRGGRSAAAVASIAGVLSCCAFEDNFRVVCGLGDASGAVVMADLRRPYTGDRPARRRTRAGQLTAQHLFPETSGQSPTGRAVTDIQRNPSCFGRIGLVDKIGTTVLTNLAALERGADSSAAVSLKQWRTIDGARVHSPVARNGASRPRLPPPPSPRLVAERLASLSAPVSRADVVMTIRHNVRGRPGDGNAQREWFHSPIPAYPWPRCAFSDDGHHFAHINAGGRAVAATVRCTGMRSGVPTGRSSSLHYPGMSATHIQIAPNTASGHATLMPSPFIAVSCVDGLFCFDTSDGHTLVTPIE